MCAAHAAAVQSNSHSTCPISVLTLPSAAQRPAFPTACPSPPALPFPSHPRQGKLKGRTREYCALLRLQPAVVDQALHVLEQAIPQLMGHWRRDLLAASAAYAACRQARAGFCLGCGRLASAQ